MEFWRRTGGLSIGPGGARAPGSPLCGPVGPTDRRGTDSDPRLGCAERPTASGVVARRTMSAMTPVDSPSDLLACVAAFGRSLDESFDPGRSLSEFSARTQRLVPHDYMVIALLEDRGQTYSLFAEYAVRGSLPGDARRYTTAFERGARVAAESFPLAPVFGGEPQLIGDVTTDDRFREATACREALDEAGARAGLPLPLFARGRGRGGPLALSTTPRPFNAAHAPACPLG